MARSAGTGRGKHSGHGKGKNVPAMKHSKPHGRGKQGTGKKPKNYNARGHQSKKFTDK